MALFDKKLEDSYISSIEKAKFLIKLAVPKQFIALKAKEKVSSLKTAVLNKLQNTALSMLKSQSQVADMGKLNSIMSASGIQRTNSLRTGDGQESNMTLKT